MDKVENVEESLAGGGEDGKPPEKPRQGVKTGPHTMKFALALMGMVFLGGVVLQSILSGPAGVSRRATVVVGLLAFLAVMVAGLSKPWRRFLSSMQFAAPALFVLTGFSVLGTLVLQGVSEQQLLAGYGPGLSRLIKGLFLDDLFHSLGFAALVGLEAGALGLVAVRKRRYNLRNTGSVLAHSGLILVLAGAAIGMVWGVKGRIDLHEGQETDSLVVAGPGGQMSRVPLGYTLRLDDFTIEKYEPDYSLMVYALSGDEQTRLFSFKPGRDSARKLAEYGLAVAGWWPNYQESIVVEAAGPEKQAALAAARLESGGKARWLFDEPGREPQPSEVGDLKVVFFWKTDRAERYLAGLTEQPGTPHQLVIDGRSRAVRLGESVDLPGGGRARLMRFFHDFVMDPQTRQPGNRSDRPNNPAVELEVEEPGGKKSRRWLFARYPDFHGEDVRGGPKLSYRYLAKAAAPPDAVLVGELGQLWLLADARIAERRPLAVGAETRLGEKTLRLVELLASARRRKVEQSLGTREDNPLLRLRLPSGKTTDLRPGKPLRYAADRFVVLAPSKGEMVRDYLSTVTVLSGGRPVLERRLVEVNSPLSYGGYSIYQADYRPEDPTYSGFQVVRDPGLYVVYLGFVGNLLGVILAIWGPVWQRRRRRLGGAA